MAEITESRTVKLPQEFYDVVKKISNYGIFKDPEALNSVREQIGKKIELFTTKPMFIGNGLDGNPVEVYFGLYNDPNAGSLAQYNIRTKTVAINIGIDNLSPQSVYRNLEHELIHAIDPKVNNNRVSDIIDKRLKSRQKAANDRGDFEAATYAYATDPAEFDSLSTEYVHNMKSNYDALSDDIKRIVRYSAGTVYSLVSKQGIDGIALIKSKSKIAADVFFPSTQDMYYLLVWKKKPTLWRRLLQRIYAEVFNQ